MPHRTMGTTICTLIMLVAVGASAPAQTTPQDRGDSPSTPATACPSPPPPAFQPRASDPDLAGVIDGARSPERIPHLVAYRLFLRSFVAPTIEETETEENPATAAAIRKANQDRIFQMLGFSEQEIVALLAIANEFGQKSRDLDRQAAEIKDRSWPEPPAEAIAALQGLQERNDDLVREVMRSLPRRMGAVAAFRLDAHISERVKRQIKIVKGADLPPARRAPAATEPVQ